MKSKTLSHIWYYFMASKYADDSKIFLKGQSVACPRGGGVVGGGGGVATALFLNSGC